MLPWLRDYFGVQLEGYVWCVPVLWLIAVLDCLTVSLETCDYLCLVVAMVITCARAE